MVRDMLGTKVAGLSAAALLCCGLAACGGDDSNSSQSTSTSASSSSASSGSGGDGGGGGGGAGGTADVCAQNNSLCFDLIVPATVTEAPKQVAVTLYSALPASGPPDGGIALLSANPMVTAGAAYSVKVSDLTASGDYFVYAVLYMPGGGMFQPVVDVDYDVSTPMKVTFQGAPVSLPALKLAKHTAGDGHGP